MMKTRTATKNDHDSIYMMGYDVWSDGADEVTYLEGCRASPKYASGSWYVLEDKEKLLSSLIVYDMRNGIYGIGSIATPVSLRKNGFASELLKNVLDHITIKSGANSVFYLYSDVGPEFYKRFQFCPVPDKFQNHSPSICMVRPSEIVQKIMDCAITVPSYF